MGSLLCIPRNQTQGQTSQSEISKIFKSDSSTDEVCFFDVIMIGNSLEGKDISVVTGDGHFTNQVRIRSSSKDHNMHRNSYFRICPTLRYDAQSETRKLERRASSASKESQDTHNGNVDEEEVALNKDAQDEKSKNSEKIDEFKDIMKGSHSRIRYGVQFQLMHMQSGKFLTFSEKDSYFILSVTGNEYSKFKFMPRYEFLDLDVNVVQYGNQVHLSCVPKGDSLLALHKDASHERDDLISPSFEKRHETLRSARDRNELIRAGTVKKEETRRRFVLSSERNSRRKEIFKGKLGEKQAMVMYTM